jgi:hypothetical protein
MTQAQTPHPCPLPCADPDASRGYPTWHLLLPGVALPALVLFFAAAVGSLSRSQAGAAAARAQHAADGFMQAMAQQPVAPPRPGGASLAALGGVLRPGRRRPTRASRPIYVAAAPAATAAQHVAMYRRGIIVQNDDLIAPMFRFPSSSTPPTLPSIPEALAAAAAAAAAEGGCAITIPAPAVLAGQGTQLPRLAAEQAAALELRLRRQRHGRRRHGHGSGSSSSSRQGEQLLQQPLLDPEAEGCVEP